MYEMIVTIKFDLKLILAGFQLAHLEERAHDTQLRIVFGTHHKVKLQRISVPRYQMPLDTISNYGLS